MYQYRTQILPRVTAKTTPSGRHNRRSVPKLPAGLKPNPPHGGAAKVSKDNPRKSGGRIRSRISALKIKQRAEEERALGA